MHTYTFRSNDNSPEGALHPTDLHFRVLASLEDMQQAGIDAEYDWTTAEVGSDAKGDFVTLNIAWPEGLGFGEARKFIDAQFVDVE